MNTRENFEKGPLLFRYEVGISEILLKDCRKKVLKIYKSIEVESFKPVPLCPIKLWSVKVFTKLRKSLLLTANIVKGAVSDLGKLLATESP